MGVTQLAETHFFVRLFDCSGWLATSDFLEGLRSTISGGSSRLAFPRLYTWAGLPVPDGPIWVRPFIGSRKPSMAVALRKKFAGSNEFLNTGLSPNGLRYSSVISF